MIWFFLHFALILAVSVRETIWVLAHGPTISPAGLQSFWQQADKFASTLSGETPAAKGPFRPLLAAYEHFAGIEAGYGYFAPNVTNSYQIGFELHYPDGRSESDVPVVSSHAAGLRLASLLDKIGRTENEDTRELMIKLLCLASFREHAGAHTIRAVLSEVELPGAYQYQRGERPTNRELIEYTFEREPAATVNQ